jgi:hypothetical protein
MKRALQLSIGIAVSAVFLWFAFRDVALADVLASMRTASPIGLVGVGLVALLGLVSRAQRWVHLFRPGTGVTIRHGFVAQSIGVAGNTVLPFRAGEGLKAYALAQRTEQPFAKVLATVVLERMFDLLGVGATLAVAMALVPIPASAGAQVNSAVRLLSIVAIGVVAGVVAFVFLRQTMLRLLDAFTARLPSALGDPVRDATHAFVDGLDTLGDPRQLVKVILLTLWVWATLAMPFALMSWVFGFDATYGAPSLHVGIVCGAIVAVFVMIPAAPGFVGTFQAGCIVALAIFGVPREPALAFSLLVHFLTLAPITVMGLIFAFRRGVLGDPSGTPRPSAIEDSAPRTPVTSTSEPGDVV